MNDRRSKRTQPVRINPIRPGGGGGGCCSFLIETSQKFVNEKFWVEKNDSGHKNSFF